MSSNILIPNCSGASAGMRILLSAVGCCAEMLMMVCCFHSSRLPGEGHFPVEEGYRVWL